MERTKETLLKSFMSLRQKIKAFKNTVYEKMSEVEGLEVKKTKSQAGRVGLKKQVKEGDMFFESMNSKIEVIKKKKDRKHEKEKGEGSAAKDEPGAIKTPTEKEKNLMKLLKVETTNLSIINKAKAARIAGLKKGKGEYSNDARN